MIKGNLYALKTMQYWKYTTLLLKVQIKFMFAHYHKSNLDYHPLHFIFPFLNGVIPLPFAIGMAVPPSLCAVYSSLQLTHFSLTFKIGRHLIPGLSRTYSQNGPIGEGMWSLTFVPNEGNQIIDSLDLYCTASTVWESVTTSRYKVDFYSNSKLSGERGFHGTFFYHTR